MTGIGRQSFTGADVDNASSAAPPHMWECSLGKEQGCPQVDGDHQVPLPGLDLGDAALKHDAGVVHEDVHAAQLLGRPFHNPGDRR